MSISMLLILILVFILAAGGLLAFLMSGKKEP